MQPEDAAGQASSGTPVSGRGSGVILTAGVALARLDGHRHAWSCPADDSCPLAGAVERLVAAAGWPPLGLRPGARVLVKPNLVAERDRDHRLTDDELAAVCTDPALVEVLVRLVWRTIEGRGEIVVADAPIEGSDVTATLARLGLDRRLARLADEGIAVSWRDLRDARLERRFLLDDVRAAGRSWNLGLLRRRAVGSPADTVTVDLGPQSYLERGLAGLERLRFHPSEPSDLAPWHARGRHAYSVSRQALEADCLISLPKLKTHQKCGLSVALKSAFGLARRKYTLPHYRWGAPPLGDEFPRDPGLLRRVAGTLKRRPLGRDRWLVCHLRRLAGELAAIEGGNWPGNDVVWRVARDLSTLLLYADPSGQLHDQPQRGCFTLVDGLTAGEGQGPLRLTPRHEGLLLAGPWPLDVDRVAARLMGFDAERLPLVAVPDDQRRPLGGAEQPPLCDPAAAGQWRLDFRRPAGW